MRWSGTADPAREVSLLVWDPKAKAWDPLAASRGSADGDQDLRDPHLRRDRYSDIAGKPDRSATLRLGVTHSPEPRVLDSFAEDGYDLIMAGHTHGGQLRVPGYGAIVTNCQLDRTRARGASRAARTSACGSGSRREGSQGSGRRRTHRSASRAHQRPAC